MRFLLSLLLITLAVSQPINADNHTDFEPILVPVYALQLRGANDSIWSTQFVVHNGSDRPVDFFPAYAGLRGPFTVSLQPGKSETRILQRLLSANHLVSSVIPKLVFIPRYAAESISFSLRVWNSKQVETSWSAQIPVVRLREFRLRHIRLLEVPVTKGFRTHLRIYSIDHDASGLFRVRGYDMRTNDLLFERTVALQITANEIDPSFADFAQLLVNSEISGDAADYRIRIEIEGDNPESRLWAFASITSDSSQSVSTVTP